jgi:hypothetical protein
MNHKTSKDSPSGQAEQDRQAAIGITLVFLGWGLWVLALILPAYSSHYGNSNLTSTGGQLFQTFGALQYMHIVIPALVCNAILLLSPLCMTGALRNASLVAIIGMLSTILSVLFILASSLFIGIGSGHLEAGAYCWVCSIAVLSAGCFMMARMTANRPPIETGDG